MQDTVKLQVTRNIVTKLAPNPKVLLLVQISGTLTTHKYAADKNKV